MLNIILVICGILCASTVAFGQLLGPDPYYQPNNRSEDLDYQDEPEDDRVRVGQDNRPANEDLNREERKELSLTSTEIRESFNSSVTLGVGSSEAWQTINLAGSYFFKRDHHFGASVGGGPWRFTGDKNDRRYEIDLIARALQGHYRYYFTERTPFFLQTALGFSFFTGDIGPVGVDTSDAEAQEEADASLRSGFRSTGLYLSQQLGWQVNWEAGLLLDFSIVGFGHTWMIQRTFTRSANDAKSAVDGELEGLTSWGILNIRLGWMF